ncbi:ribosomal protein L5 domain-containing protein [Jimgerdemannia flammicorona]|uniref:Large ribosomal subunit protein uL5m n=1 Tax=Jimgerdemannia flammicorona TaxID=994334 RepID=A0A433D326_9FUNG|nr:ribosomal protein L5 domain-containing protein [Jimgerdemannia flammicorona]
MILTYDHRRVKSPSFRSPELQSLADEVVARPDDEFAPNAKEAEEAEEEAEEAEEAEETEETAAAAADGSVLKRKGNKPLRPTPPLSSPKTIPQLHKITVHAMVKEAINNKASLLSAFMALQCISAARPEIIYARRSVASWKLREGMPIGVKVELRGDNMYQFLDKLVEIVLPRLKEWHGLPLSAGDGNGNLAIGFPPSALALFPEIEGSFDMFPRMTGFDVIFNTTGYTNTEGRLLLSGFSVPFREMGRAGKRE